MKNGMIMLAALSLAATAHASDYLFGGSSNSAGNVLTINGAKSLAVADSGWYSDTGYHDPTNTNYLVGQCGACTFTPTRNWFAFDISTLRSPVTSLSLTLRTFATVTETGLDFYVNDFAGSVDALIAGAGGIAAYIDMASGNNYGVLHYELPLDSFAYRTITFNEHAVADLNAAIANGRSMWAVGGSLIAPQPIPEPTTTAMMLAGLCSLVAIRLTRPTPLQGLPTLSSTHCISFLLPN